MEARPPRLSLVWRIPAAAALAVVALICFALDDAWRALKRLATRIRTTTGGPPS